MPRKKKIKPEETAAVAIAEPTPLPAPEPTFAERVRPTGPRPRNGEAVAIYASDDLRISKDGQMYQLEDRGANLSGEEKDRLAASGFHAADDDEKFWNASQGDLNRRGSDINHVAFAMKTRDQGRGR